MRPQKSGLLAVALRGLSGEVTMRGFCAHHSGSRQRPPIGYSADQGIVKTPDLDVNWSCSPCLVVRVRVKPGSTPVDAKVPLAALFRSIWLRNQAAASAPPHQSLRELIPYMSTMANGRRP